MTTRRARHGASIYRTRSNVFIGKTHMNERDITGIIQPVYRGWRIACLAEEFERLKRGIDNYWADAHQAAKTLPELKNVLLAEYSQRLNPVSWPPNE
jgi:hypothetical protein